MHAGLILVEFPPAAVEFGVHEEVRCSGEKVGGKDEAEDKIYDQQHLISACVPNYLDSLLNLGLDLL